ncbi:MAG: efflux RND transporter periplasmic adaptor subunit [Acidobacteriaceae bacterium]
MQLPNSMNMKLKKQHGQDCSTQTSTRMHRIAAPLFLFAFTLSGCKHDAAPASAGAPPSAQVEEIGGSNLVHLDGAGRFSLVQASSQPIRSKLQVTGTVNPDVSREIPVLSLANGRVIALHVGLGDYVHKGQLVMEVQSPDVSTAFDAYLKAINNEHLTSITLERDTLLYNKGAIARSQLQSAQNGEDDAKADLTAAEQQLKILGVDKNHPSENVRIYAPASGVIIAQNVTAAGAVGITYAGAAGSLTIADLSHVWVICDVYENDLASVRVGQHADIQLNAFPGKTFSGTISNIGAELDPTTRTAKVRIQVENPQHLLRIGMFATGTIEGAHPQQRTVVPADAVLQLHDRTYVFEPAGNDTFKRVQLQIGQTLPGNLLEVVAGVEPGQQVVNNALELENAADEQ